MKPKKVFYTIITLLIIAVLGSICYLLFTNISLEQDNQKLQEKNNTLNERIQIMDDQIHILKNQIDDLTKQPTQSSKPNDSTKTCTFIRTYHYLTTLDSIGQIGEKFIVWEQYQGTRPFILSLEKDFGIQFEKNAAYEIKFEGPISNGEDITKYKIFSIQKTNKVGMGQVQESCKEVEA